MNKSLNFISVFAISLLTTVSSVFAVESYFNGFEADTTGWNNFGGGVITRVISGTNGITSTDGGFHAEVDGPVYTDWGGYENVFPTDGYVTKIDIYLDTALADGNDKRFDFSSAINKPDGTHLRDFIFHVGTVPGLEPTNQWAVSASNNSPGWPLNQDNTPILLSESGWYTFEHQFKDNGEGVLEVVMSVKDSDGGVLGSWTLSDPTDLIGVSVGGNRYGWFTEQQFDFDMLAIDNSEKNNTITSVESPTEKDSCKKDGWMLFASPVFKNQGDCVSYVQSNEKAEGNRKNN